MTSEPLRTKHTIEVEVEWNVAPRLGRRGDWHFIHGIGFEGGAYRSTEQLASIGITKPKPPFEVGDLIMNNLGHVLKVVDVQNMVGVSIRVPSARYSINPMEYRKIGTAC